MKNSWTYLQFEYSQVANRIVALTMLHELPLTAATSTCQAECRTLNDKRDCRATGNRQIRLLANDGLLIGNKQAVDGSNDRR